MERLLSWYMLTFKRPSMVIPNHCVPTHPIPYLRRFFLLGHATSKWALMLHCFHRSDIDRCLHDHPWPFVSLILNRGYYEVTDKGTKWYGPLSLLSRPAEWKHRVALRREFETVWTLVLRFSKTRAWGFHTDKGWIYYRDYDYKAGCE